MASVDAGRNGDADVTFDIYPYPSGSSIPVSFLPGAIQEGGPAAILRRLSDETLRRDVGTWLDNHQSEYMRMMCFSYVPERPELEGTRLVDLATGLEGPTKYERSDFCPVPRAVPILEAMVAFVLADALLEKLGGDSLAEMLPRFAALRQARLEDLPMDNTDHIFWE